MIYAVNNTTKEHRVITGEAREVDDWRSKMQGWHVVKADTNGWIEWHGGECPLPDGVKYDVRCARGSEGRHREPEGDNWLHVHGGSNIIAYRPVIDQPASGDPKEWGGWKDGAPPVDAEVKHPTGQGIVMLPPDSNGMVIVKSTNADYSAGEYKRVPVIACRPLTVPTPRERWVENASEHYCDDDASETMSRIYDALASGELPTPEKTR